MSGRNELRRGASALTYALAVGGVAVSVSFAVSETGTDVRGLLTGVTGQVNAVDGLVAGNAGPVFDGTLPTLGEVGQYDPMPAVAVTGFSDPEGDALTYSLRLTGDLAPGDLNASRIAGGVSVAGAPSGAGSFTVVATDPLGRTAEAGPIAVPVALNQAPLAPAATGPFSTLDDDPMTTLTLDGFSDPETDPMTFTLSGLGALASDLTVTGLADGVEIAGTPTTPGIYDLVVTATDDHGLSTAAAPVTLEVIANRAPTFNGTVPSPVAITVGESISLTFSGFGDPDGDDLDYAAIDINGHTVVDGGGWARVDAMPDPGNFLVAVSATDGDGLSVTSDAVSVQVRPLSCKDYLEANPDAPSGTYTIDPDGPGGDAPFDAYCEMGANGGGWTRITPQIARQELGGWMTNRSGLRATHESFHNDRPRTRDEGGDHEHYYQFNWPAGATQFYMDGYYAYGWSANRSGKTDRSEYGPDNAYGTNWRLDAAQVYGDIGFGTGSTVITSFAADGSKEGCYRCKMAFSQNGTVFDFGTTTTRFRMGWGEFGGQWEGWYPWHSGYIYLR